TRDLRGRDAALGVLADALFAVRARGARRSQRGAKLLLAAPRWVAPGEVGARALRRAAGDRARVIRTPYFAAQVATLAIGSAGRSEDGRSTGTAALADRCADSLHLRGMPRGLALDEHRAGRDERCEKPPIVRSWPP